MTMSHSEHEAPMRPDGKKPDPNETVKRLKIIGLVGGTASPFDGKFVAAYDPAYHPIGQKYDGGRLEVTDDPAKALQFPSVIEAMECWKKSHGTRPDGKPNRPLTAFTVEVV